MYLASTPSHLPLAVFDHFADAEAYLCSLENVSLRFACVDRLNLKSEIHKVYTEAYGESPEKILGYITPGVQINPNYVVQ